MFKNITKAIQKMFNLFQHLFIFVRFLRTRINTKQVNNNSKLVLISARISKKTCLCHLDHEILFRVGS